MKHEKIKPRLITSRQALQAVVADIVDLRLLHAEKTARMEQEIAAVQKSYQDELVNLSRQIECNEAGAQVWAEQNRAEFGDKKSLDVVVAVVGFRTTPHRVEKRNSKETWGKIARKLQALVWGEAYVREPDPECNKEQLLQDRAKLSEEQLAAAGIRFEQDENFYIEPKSQVLDTTIKQAA
ncbi:MAG TPA: host-nuclease inhibitor Gam family protein [Verrucomicrobiae bacterium]|jgi:phage host-nuclease inhibitor protein Gam|nr:host-nuclease inhibitor Gam family protein [Verrucomicrobiae bacterium]